MAAAQVVVMAAEAARQPRAARIARELGLPVVRAAPREADLLLVAGRKGLELRDARLPQAGPVRVDFLAGPIGYRRRVGRFGLLFQAVGLRPGFAPSVIDATCGLGRDAFLLAHHGCRVVAIERAPIVAALVRDGLRRAADEPAVRAMLDARLRLVVGDARELLPRLAADAPPDVVFLDPMFPPKRKSALVKKEMRILRRLVGDDPDAAELFEIARAAARRRVVVKRMRHAPLLAPNPAHVYRQKTTRYDVYT